MPFECLLKLHQQILPGFIKRGSQKYFKAIAIQAVKSTQVAKTFPTSKFRMLIRISGAVGVNFGWRQKVNTFRQGFFIATSYSKVSK